MMIRKATMDDLIPLVDLLHRSLLGQVYFDTREDVSRSAEEGLQKEDIYVAENDGALLGFCWFTWRGAFHSYPYLHIIVVDKTYQGRGVGTALLKHYEELIFPHCSKTFLCVADFNVEAKKLYERLGYVQVGAIPGLYRLDITEYLMMKRRPIE